MLARVEHLSAAGINHVFEFTK